MSKSKLHDQALKANANNIIKKLQAGKTASASDLKALQQVADLTDAEAGAGTTAPVSEWTLNATDLCDMLRCSKRHLYNLEADGIVVKDGPSRYRLRDCVRNRIADLQGKGGVSTSEHDREELKKLKAEARIAEAKARREEGKSMDAAKTRREWEHAVLHVRAKLLGIADRLGAQLVIAPDVVAAKLILNREVLDILEQLANYRSATEDEPEPAEETADEDDENEDTEDAEK